MQDLLLKISGQKLLNWEDIKSGCGLITLSGHGQRFSMTVYDSIHDSIFALALAFITQ